MTKPQGEFAVTVSVTLLSKRDSVRNRDRIDGHYKGIIDDASLNQVQRWSKRGIKHEILEKRELVQGRVTIQEDKRRGAFFICADARQLLDGVEFRRTA
jgi:hypothetical protein